jgi:hypothetical protein
VVFRRRPDQRLSQLGARPGLAIDQRHRRLRIAAGDCPVHLGGVLRRVRCWPAPALAGVPLVELAGPLHEPGGVEQPAEHLRRRLP